MQSVYLLECILIHYVLPCTKQTAYRQGCQFWQCNFTRKCLHGKSSTEAQGDKKVSAWEKQPQTPRVTRKWLCMQKAAQKPRVTRKFLHGKSSHRHPEPQENCLHLKAAQKLRVTRESLHGKSSTEDQGEHLIALTPLVWPLQVCTQRLGRKQCSFSALRSLGASSQLRPA